MYLKGLTAVGAVTFALSATVASAQTVSLVEAYNRMIESDLQFEVLELEANIAQEVIQQARAQRRPRVTLTFDYTQTAQEIISQDNEVFTEGSSEFPTQTISLSVTQPLYDAVAFRARPLAEAQAALTEAQADVARNQLNTLLVDSYLAVARAQIVVDRARALVRAREELQRMMQEQVDAGRLDEDRMLRSRGDLFGAQSDLFDAEILLSDALFEFYRFTGPEVEGVAFQNASSLNFLAFSNEFTEDRLLEVSPEVLVARAEQVVSEGELESTKGAFRPTVNLSLQYSLEETEGSLFGGGSEVATTEYGVTFSQSIYEGGERRSRKREAEQRVELASVRVQQIEELALRRYNGLLQAIERSNQRGNSVIRQLAFAEQAYQAAIAQEDAGRVGADFVLEQELRRDILRSDARLATLRTLELQVQLFSLFGALDLGALSGQFDSRT